MGGYREADRGGGEDRRTRDARTFVENFEDMVAHLRPGEPVPAVGGIDGTDATGTVYCVVDTDGALLRVGIDDGWWDALGPGRVAGAVLEALRFAKAKATMARLVLDRHGHPADGAPRDLGMVFTSEPSEPLPSYEASDFPEALSRKANRSLTILDRAETFSRLRDSAERRVVTGPRGLFRVILSGAEIVGAETNEYGLRRSDAADLAEDARAALQAASSTPHGEAR
jgi:hypothetical protein